MFRSLVREAQRRLGSAPVKESVRKGVGQQNLKPDWYVAHRAATPIMQSFIVLTAQGTLCRQV
jgi:hypothetical protein